MNKKRTKRRRRRSKWSIKSLRNIKRASWLFDRKWPVRAQSTSREQKPYLQGNKCPDRRLWQTNRPTDDGRADGPMGKFTFQQDAQKRDAIIPSRLDI